MHFLFNASGANAPLIKDFPIDGTTAVYDGAVVGVKDGKIVPAGTHDALIGVSAEDHSGTKELLNPRADGENVRVIFAPDTVYASPAQLLTVTAAGSSTTVKVSSTGVSGSLSNGRLVLVAKAADSANTDCLGTVRPFTACAVSGATATFTVSAGAVASVGDVYALYPPVGTTLHLADDGMSAVSASSSAVTFTLAVTDEKNGVWGVRLDDTYLA